MLRRELLILFISMVSFAPSNAVSSLQSYQPIEASYFIGKDQKIYRKAFKSKKHERNVRRNNFFKMLFRPDGKRKIPFGVKIALILCPVILFLGIYNPVFVLVAIGLFALLNGIGMIQAKKAPEKYDGSLARALFFTAIIFLGGLTLISLLVLLAPHD